MNLPRWARIVGRDLRVGWKGIAAGLVPVVLLALLSLSAGQTFTPATYTFPGAVETAAGVPRSASASQAGDVVSFHVGFSDLVADPPDGTMVGVPLTTIGGDSMQARAVAEVRDGEVVYELRNETRFRRSRDPIVGWFNGTYNGQSQQGDPMLGPIEGELPSPPGIRIDLTHATQPGDLADLALVLLDASSGRELARSDGDDGSTGEESIRYLLADGDPQDLRVRIEGVDPKPNANVEFTTRVELQFAVLPPDSEVLAELTGAWDAAGDEVRIDVNRSELFESASSRDRVRYAAFVAEDHRIVAGNASGNIRDAGSFRVTSETVDARFISRALFPLMGFTAMVGLVAFAISVFMVYGREISRGSIRSLLHYPLSYNDVHTIKAVSALIPAVAVTAVFAATVLPNMAATMEVPDALVGTVVTRVYASYLLGVAMITGIAYGLSTVVARWTHRMVLAFHRAFLLVYVLAAVLTETFLTFVFVGLGRQFGIVETQAQAEWLTDLARGLAQVSPLHAAGRVASAWMGIDWGLDLHLVVPATAALVVAGVWTGRRLYPDVLLSESVA